MEEVVIVDAARSPGGVTLPLPSPLGRGNSCHPRYQHSCHGPHFFSVWKLFLFCSNWTDF